MTDMTFLAEIIVTLRFAAKLPATTIITADSRLVEDLTYRLARPGRRPPENPGPF